MGIISGIKEKLKIFLSDIRKNLGLLIIITIIWVMLIFGIVFLKVYVGPLQPISTLSNYLDPVLVNLLTQVVQALLGGSYVLIWLYLWYRMVRMYFWRTMKKYYNLLENLTEEQTKKT